MAELSGLLKVGNFIEPVIIVCPADRTHRYYLGYHSTSQVLWGVGIGILLGISLYVVAELIPRKRPFSILGKTKRALLSHPLSQWFRIRDGWAVWTDGGREDCNDIVFQSVRGLSMFMLLLKDYHHAPQTITFTTCSLHSFADNPLGQVMCFFGFELEL
ncbi:hypothetical protein H2248_010893 [Termitomyces sp. 'cryptogamus']|nr:hypothetical protein H2248_010893 [Termitomyces sp. 'cryptogamus']